MLFWWPFLHLGGISRPKRNESPDRRLEAIQVGEDASPKAEPWRPGWAGAACLPYLVGIEFSGRRHSYRLLTSGRLL